MKAMKKCISLMLAIIMVASIFSNFSAVTLAASEKMDCYQVKYPRSTDKNQSGWGHEAKKFLNGWSVGATNAMTTKSMGGYYGQLVYCIEQGVPILTGDTLTSMGETFWDKFPSSLNSTIKPSEMKSLIGRILEYGYQGNNTTEWQSTNAADRDKLGNYEATQILIWETVVGERDEDFQKIDVPSGYDTVLSIIDNAHPCYTEIMKHYKSIEEDVKKHTKVPSFMSKSKNFAKSYELDWDSSGYTLSLTDQNGVLSNYSFSSSDKNISLAKSGNVLKISSVDAPDDGIIITAEKTNSKRAGLIVWTDGVISQETEQIQDIVTYGAEVNDSITAYLKLKVGNGTVKIVKTSEDGKVDGISFNVIGDDVNKTVKTNSKGEINIENLKPGIYTITEQTDERYTPQNSQNVTVISGKTSTVTFNNKLKRGSLEVIKNSEDNIVEGVRFHLYGTSLSGLTVDEYAETNSKGVAKFKNILISGDAPYTLEEVDTAEKYVVPKSQTVSIEWQKEATRTFNNVLKKFNVTVTKLDKETGSAQGNSTLAGAVYGIYKGDQLIDRYTTDSKGQFRTKDYVCGNDWYIREISPSEGYKLDKTSYHIGAEAKNFTVEYNSITQDVKEQVIKGNIEITKVDKDYPDNKLTGTIFEVYTDTNGNGEFDKEDKLIGEMSEQEKGIYQMNDLRYGLYFVSEKSAPIGFILDENIYSIFIEKNGKTYVVENEVGIGFSNEAMKGNLKIVKTSSDGKIEGFSFRVIGPNEYDKTFKTDKKGEILIENLRIGEYIISEIRNKTSEEYILPLDKQVTVKMDSTTIVDMHNELRDTPKTGDSFNIIMWVSIAGISVVGIVTCASIIRRKKKKGRGGFKNGI